MAIDETPEPERATQDAEGSGIDVADVIPLRRADRRATPPAEAPERDVALRDLLGEVLREERHSQDRTLAEVAEAAAVSLQYLSEVERGRKDVSSDLLGAIHRALGLELADVLERASRRLEVRHRSGPGLRMLAA